MPLRTTSQPILPRRKGGVSLADLLQQLRRREPLTAEALEILASGHNAVVNTLRQPPPSLEDVTVTDPTGAPIARIGSWVEDGVLRSGFWTREFYQAGEGPDTAVLYSDENGNLIIGKNGSATVLDPFGGTAAWIGAQWDTLDVTGAANNGTGLIRLTVALHGLITGDEVLVGDVGGVPNATGVWTVTVIDPNTIDLQESGFGGAYTGGGWVSRVLHVTGAADNGSGLIRLTIAGHGYESGDTVNVHSVGGVANATGQWIVTVVDANHIDLEGSTFAGAYGGGGICVRYFAGGLFQNIAIGPSFSDYRLRAFPDGSLRLRDATFRLTINGVTASIDEIPRAFLPSYAGLQIREDATGARVNVGPGFLEMYNADGFTNGPVYISADGGWGWIDLLNTNGSGHEIRLSAQLGSIDASGPIEGHSFLIDGTTVINPSRHADFVAVESDAYSAGGTAGIDASQEIVTNVTYSTGTVSGVTVVTGITISKKTLSGAKGLLTGLA
jgi:hypothetical protein